MFLSMLLGVMLIDVLGFGSVHRRLRLRSSRLGRLFGQLFRGRCSGTLVLLCHEIPDARAYWGQHRKVGDGAIEVACGKGGRILRKEPPLDKVKMVLESKTSARLLPP
jgi:hypothetical protein